MIFLSFPSPQVPGNVTTLLADGLTPYTAYQFQVAACTIAGCTTSMPSTSVHTLKARK